LLSAPALINYQASSHYCVECGLLLRME